MKRNVFALWRMFVLAAFVPALAFSLAACEPENGGGTGTGGEEDETEDTTSEIAVTGLVDKFGCTYADISGYANLNLLPAGSGNPVIGVEVVEAKAETNENAVQTTAGSLIGNIFTVSFSHLSPATEYKYRSFVTYGGITYYGTKYKTFTTKEVVNVTSTGEASDIKRASAVLSASVQTEGVDVRDNVFVGLAWSTSESAICAGGDYDSRTVSVREVQDGVFSASLSGLSVNTTYYYASFTEVGGVYVFSSVKEFTTDVLRLETGAVDLGLSVKWAGCNVGADTPEEYGYYFAWGETTTKSFYAESNSVTYGLSISALESRGIIGADGNLTAAYDAATANWGSDWRMPTLDEMKELINQCTWEWISINGVNGRLVTGPNGNSIFLPAAGCRHLSSLDNAGSYGVYWSATPYSSSYGTYGTYDLYFNDDAYYFNDGDNDWHSYNRLNGQAVRPVSEE